MKKARTSKISIKNEPTTTNDAVSSSRKLKKPLHERRDSVASVLPKRTSNTAGKPPRKKSWATIAEDAKEIQLAVDTEFEGRETLTIQFALRVNEKVVVQIYHSPRIPAPPRNCFSRKFAVRFPEQVNVIVRPAKVITADLLPRPV